MTTISRIKAREVLDSRGNPTVEVDVVLSNGTRGRASVPSGASTGKHEAVEVRDGDPDRYSGLGVQRAIDNVHGQIAPELEGRPGIDQESLDTRLIELDGTPDKSRLGGNAILAVSVAFAHAAARSRETPLFTYFGGGGTVTLPVPMLNILNGGRHAENSTDFQEFMVVPAGFESFREALRAGVEVYHTLRQVVSEQGFGTSVGDEGGFAPALGSNRRAVEIILTAIERAGYEPGRQCFIALDVAASEFQSADGRYNLHTEQVSLSSEELVQLYEQWAREYPIISVEDGMAEDEWDGWSAATKRLGDRVQLVGDDLYTTNPGRIRRGIECKASNAVLIKLNQIGTVTETLEAIQMTKKADWGTVISHRSGETEDTTIADLAVGTTAGQIKSGVPARGERTAKYNRLLRIEEELEDRASFAGRTVYERFLR